MKKQTGFALFLCLGLMTTACGRIDRTDKDAAITTSAVEKSSEIQKTTVKETEAEVTEKYDSSDGLPPVNQQMKQFYKEAEQLFMDIVFFRIKCDSEQPRMGESDDKVLYYRVTDERYSTMEKIKQALGKYFTKQFTEDLVSAKMWNEPRFREYDGALYMLQAQRSGNIQYAGHVFETVESGGDIIKMPVKVYYALYATPYEHFYKYPEDKTAYEVKEYTQIMVKEDGEWKFSQFELFY